LKVLVVIDLFYPIFTGQGIFIERLLNELNNNNITANVLTINVGGKYKEIERMNNFDIHRLNVVTRKNIIHYLISYFTCFKWFQKNRNEFDIIHLHQCSLQFWIPIILAKIFWNKRIVLEMCLYGTDDPIVLSKGRFGLFFSKVIPYIDHYIALSEPIKKACLNVKIPNSRISKISQMVDVNKYKPVDKNTKMKIREYLGLTKKSFIIIFTGSIIYRKGVDILIKAFENAVKVTEKDLVLLLVGRRHSKTNCDTSFISFVNKIDEMIVNSKYLNNRVYFPGLVDHVEKYLQASDLFVFPSRREGFGASTIEALSVGLPCIVSPLDGISKNDIFLGSSEGMIADLSIESFASAMIELIENEEERSVLAKNARRRTLETFSVEKIVNKYVKLYQAIL